MQTTILDMFGGPGCGKSTTAAYIYYRLKDANRNSELVREYVKDWAWQDRKITAFDQPYILGKQLHREAPLYGKVEFIVTDSPLLLSIYYAQRHSPARVARGVEETVLGFYEQVAALGHHHQHIMLKRSKPYCTAGRYQDEQGARDIDNHLMALMDHLDMPYIEIGTNRKELDDLVDTLLAG